MKIVVLGAAGFIGSHMIEHLVAHPEHEIVAIDITGEKLEGIDAPNLQFHQLDIREEAELVDRLSDGCDVIVDLVAYANPSIYVATPLKVFELNFTQNMKVIDLCLKHGAKLIQYSSAEVYGKLTEGGEYLEDGSDSVFGPVHKQRWIYATSKVLLERVIHAHGEASNLEYTVIRPFNFCGSRIDYLVPANTQGGPRVFAHFMSALLTGGPIQLVDGGHAHRTFLHIKDANRAFQTILDQPEASRNQIYNVGNPDNDIAIRDLADVMIELYEELTGDAPSSPVVDVSGEAFYGEGYEDANRLPPSIEKIRGLGWEPQYDLRKTLRDTMSYYLTRWEDAGEAMLTG